MSVICMYILITLYIKGCTGDILMSQTPESVTVQPGESAVISCTASSTAIGKYWVWYHQKPGQAPKFIMDFATSSTSGRYQGSQRDLEFSLTISNIQTEDAGVYHCQQRQSFPFTQSLWFTFGGGTKLIVKTGVAVRPSVSLLPPSSEQLSAGDSATLACLLSGYNPPGAQVIWEVEGKEVTAGVLTSEEVEKDGRCGRSSTLTMSKALWEQGEVFTCKVTHEGDTQSTEITRTQCGK